VIIAEIGINHLGDKNKLNLFCDELAKTDFDAVTVQVREPEFYNNLKYRGMSLTDHAYRRIAKQIKLINGQKFGVALADIEKLSMFEEIGCDFYKILSKDFLNAEFVKEVFEKVDPKKQIMFSTGTSSHDDIQKFMSDNRKDLNRIGLIHTQLTNDVEEVNLRALHSLREDHNVPISFGNHCSVLEVLYAAQAFSPEHSLVYVKGNDDYSYPDDLHAVPVKEAAELSRKIKLIQMSLGSGNKKSMKNNIEGQE
jgi:sialic acid synthase SpsE